MSVDKFNEALKGKLTLRLRPRLPETDVYTEGVTTKVVLEFDDDEEAVQWAILILQNRKEHEIALEADVNEDDVEKMVGTMGDVREEVYGQHADDEEDEPEEMFAEIVWDGSGVGASLTCSCGAATSKDICVDDCVECASCHKVWRTTRIVTCVAATESEIAEYRARYYGKRREAP